MGGIMGSCAALDLIHARRYYPDCFLERNIVQEEISLSNLTYYNNNNQKLCQIQKSMPIFNACALTEAGSSLVILRASLPLG